MTHYQRISAEQAKTLLDQGSAVADIRDAESYRQNHIRGAQHLSNENLQSFLESSDLDAPLLVYCYHGHSSQMAAEHLIEQGFEEVFSLDGGFQAWFQSFPEACTRD